MTQSTGEERLKQQPSETSTSTEKQSEASESASNLPTGTRLLAIIVSILLAMFLVALVCLPLISCCPDGRRWSYTNR
jgi:hypothetical protein